MRRRVRKFLPVFLVALLVQVFAPIGATWAASSAASDPLQASPLICSAHEASTPGQFDPPGQQRAHEGCCSVCSVLHTGAPVDAPQAAVPARYRLPEQVVWLAIAPDLSGSRAGSQAQARAPPSIS
jgi:hypothetical protein